MVKGVATEEAGTLGVETPFAEPLEKKLTRLLC